MFEIYFLITQDAAICPNEVEKKFEEKSVTEYILFTPARNCHPASFYFFIDFYSSLTQFTQNRQVFSVLI